MFVTARTLYSLYCAGLWSDFTKKQMQILKGAFDNGFHTMQVLKLPFRSSVSETFIPITIPTFDML